MDFGFGRTGTVYRRSFTLARPLLRNRVDKKSSTVTALPRLQRGQSPPPTTFDLLNQSWVILFHPDRPSLPDPDIELFGVYNSYYYGCPTP